jgi:IS6 family transposase
VPCAWYLRYSLSLRDVEELFAERGMEAHHTSIWRWVQCYGPELEQRLRRQLKPTNKSWRVDETYIRVKGRWCYLYRAALKKEGILRRRCRHRPVQYLKNILEQDHRAIKRRVKFKQSSSELQAARRTTEGYEAMHMIRKGQARWVSGDHVCQQNQFIDQLFDLAA